MSYQHLHSDPEVGEKIQELFDALARYERGSDGSVEHLVLVLPLHAGGIPVCRTFGGFVSPAAALRMAAESPHASRTDAPQHPRER